MRTTYLLELDVPADPGLADHLTALGGVPGENGLLWALPDDTVLGSACTVLVRSGTFFRTFHRLIPTDTDPAADRACYLALTVWDPDIPVEPGRPGLYRDVATSTVVGTRAAVDLLRVRISGARFEPADGHSTLFRLTSATTLPDPVVVPVVFARGRADDGVWAVRSDGRELLTEANRRMVRERGLVDAPLVRLLDEILPWRRPPIVSGEIWALLEAHEVRGLMRPPPYLGPV